jgi:lipopolysaccharide transport system ATP-binding protein
MNKNIAIKVQNLTKVYKLYDKPIDRLKESLHPFKKKYHKEFHALDNVSFEIKKGETVGIIGKNGSGKSTLLKIITGVLTPTSGRVTIHGKISAILELGAGFNPEMTGLENIYLNTSINGMTKEETKKKINDIVEFAELGEHINQPIKTYSSGMKARLAFSVSINVEPDILIVDEALSVGDAAFARKCFAKMEEIRQSGATILFVSHSEGSIVSLCNRAIWISNGNQIIDGEPKLVTGLYMKHINEKKIEKLKIMQEYKSLENTKDNKEIKKIEVTKEKPNVEQCDIKDKSSIAEFYNPALKSKSTIYYEEKGAKISDVKITTLDGKEVNVLTQENKYIITCNCNILYNFEDVRIGIAIKDNKGIYYSGVAYELLKHGDIKILQAGKYKIEFIFDCLIVDGIFILDVVIFKNFNKTKEIAHRVNDSYLFKVLKLDKNNIIQSHVPMIKDIQINEIN